MSKFLAAATAAAVLLTGSLGFAAEYFVDPAGSDSNPGTSATSAWATLAALSKIKAGDTVNFKAGGQWTATGGITIKGATYQAYGTGARPRIDGVKITFATVQLQAKSVLDGFFITADAQFGVYLVGDNSIVRNCEIDGTASGMAMALGIMGSHNLVTQNYAHDLSQNAGDTGNVNSSGGAECYVVFGGSDIEVSYNSAIKCACKNKTLGGDEGGCVEIINPDYTKIIENVRFHHNYCEQDVGKFTTDYRLAAGSPAIDKATAYATDTEDIDKHAVPCGSAADIGASEYCDGAPSIPQGIGGTLGGGTGGAQGTGGATGSGGAKGTAGAQGTGGGVGGSAIGSGGRTGSGGTVGTGGGVGSGGASGPAGSGGAQATTVASASGGAVGVGGSTAGSGGATGSGGSAPTAAGASKGCACAVGGRGTSGGAFLLLAVALLWPMLRRRR